MTSNYAIVRDVLARHLQCEPSAIRPWLHFEGELDMTPLEIVLIAAELEAALDLDIPPDGLAAVSTVVDLVRLVGKARAREAAKPRPMDRTA